LGEIRDYSGITQGRFQGATAAAHQERRMRNSKGRFGRGGGAGARRSGCDRRARIAKSRALGPVPLSFHRTPDAAHRRLREPRGPRRAQARVGRPRQGFLEQRGGPPALRPPPHEHRTGQPLARNWHDGLKPRNERKPPILPIVSDELASGQHLFQRHDGTQLRRGERGKKPVSPWSTRSGPAHGVYFVLRVEAGITAPASPLEPSKSRRGSTDPSPSASRFASSG